MSLGRAALAVVAVTLAACGALTPSPRDAFRDELFAKLDELAALLRSVQPDRASTDEAVVALTDKGVTPPLQSNTPSVLVINRKVDEIIRHLEAVPVELAADPEGFDAWGADLAAGYRARVDYIAAEVRRIKNDYQRDPSRFAAGSSVFGPLLGLTAEGDLYFGNGNGGGYLLEKRLEVDLDAWLAAVKSAGAGPRRPASPPPTPSPAAQPTPISDRPPVL